jgi:hypothetical protein
MTEILESEVVTEMPRARGSAAQVSADAIRRSARNTS